MKFFFWIFSPRISIPSSSVHVRCIVTFYNFYSFILRLLGDSLIIKLLIILFQSVLLALPLFTSKYQSCNIFFYQRHSASLGPSLSGIKLTLIQKWILTRLVTVVFGWEVGVAGVLSPLGLTWTTSILFCTYLLSVTVCAAVKQLEWKDQMICTLHVIWAYSLTCAFRHF
jgi:hypothetical protein